MPRKHPRTAPAKHPGTAPAKHPRTAPAKRPLDRSPAAKSSSTAARTPPRDELRRARIAVVLLVVSPAVIVPGALDRFVFGKLLVAALGIAVAATVTATGRLSRTLRWLLAAASALTLLAALASDSVVAALFGRQPLSEGAFVLATYVLAGLAGVRLLGPGRTPTVERTAVQAMAWCAVAVAVLAIVESAGLRPLSSTLDRPGSLLGNASDQGVLGVLYAGPLVLAAVRDRRPVPLAGAVACGLCVVLSASRGALIGLAVALVVVALLSVARAREVAIGALVAAAALAFAVPFTRDRILALTPLASQTVGGRRLLWSESLSMYGRHPLLGVGPSGFENALPAEHDFRWQHMIGAADPPASPHNWLLQVLLVGGPLLLAVVLAIVMLTVRGALAARVQRPAWADGVLAGLSGTGAALLFHFPAPSTAIPAAVLAGSVLAVPAAAARREVLVRGLTIGVAAVLSVCFALGAVAEWYLRSAYDDVAAQRYAAADAAFGTARALRIWDVDLPFQAMHQFTAAATAGSTAAMPYARKWDARLGPIDDDEQVIQNRAALRQADGQPRAALAMLDAALRRDPDDTQLLLLRGVVQGQLGRLTAAVRDFRRVTVIDNRDPKPWHDLAIIYRALGRSADANAAAARAHALGG